MYSNNPPMRGIANSMAQHGRYGDSMLVHMNPHEVQGIAALSPTGKLTTNPITGQPEAFLPFLAPLLGSMFGSTILGGLGSALGSTALSGLGAALTSVAGNAALSGAIGSGLATTAVTGDLEKGIMSGITGFGLGKAVEAAGAALNPQIGETAAALGDASTVASEAGKNLALTAAETADPIAKAIEMGAAPATNPLTGELVNQGFSPAAVTDPLTGAAMNPALNPSQIAMADPMQKLLDAEGVRNTANAKVANLSEQLSSLRGSQTAGDKILAPFKQPGAFGKKLLEPGVLTPIAIGEGQRAQMQAVEEAEERNRRFKRKREEDYRRNAAIMEDAYDQLDQDYPGYKVARDSQYAAAGGITSIDPNNYMDNIKGLQRLAGGGVVMQKAMTNGDALNMPSFDPTSNFGGSIPPWLEDTGLYKAGAAPRQGALRGTEVISPEELVGYRPGFSPEINYFRTPANPDSANQPPIVTPDHPPNGYPPYDNHPFNYNPIDPNFNLADLLNTEAGAANIATLRDALNIPSFDPTSLQDQIDANRELASTPSFDPESFKSDILSNMPSFDASGLQERLSAVENRNIPGFDASDLQSQIDAMRNQPGFDASGLQEQINALRNQPGFDASGLQERLSAVENRNIPGFDASGLQSQIDAMRNQPGFDASGLQSQIDAMRNQPGFDASGLQERLSAMENREIPGFDDSALREMIAANTEQFGQIPSFDASGLQERLSAMENREIPGFDDSALREMIAANTEQFGQIPSFDASDIQGQIDALRNQPGFDASDIQGQINALRNQPGFDASGLQERLSALETRETPGFDASDLQSQIDAMRNQPGFDASDLQSQIDAMRNQPGFDASGLQSQIDAMRNQPGFDDAALREMIAANTQNISNAPGFDDAALREMIAANTQSIGNAPGFNDADLRAMIAANTQNISNAPGFDASGLQEQINALRNQPGFDASGLQGQIDALRNQPGFDASGLQGQINAMRNQPGFDDAALRAMIAANSQQIQNALSAQPGFDNAPSFDPSRFNPGFDPSRFNPGEGMAEGRLVESELADESMLETKETNGQLVIERAVMAISGELSPEDSESAINMFLDEFGPEAFQFLREKVLQDIVPGAQIEGKISGAGSGMGDEVTGMIGNQQPVAVSPGEYIVPADVVSGIGDGSTDAGAAELDEMLERVRMERTGTTEQPQPMRRGGGLPA